MNDLLCANCAYEVEGLEEMGYCQTCARAFRIGYRVAQQEGASV